MEDLERKNESVPRAIEVYPRPNYRIQKIANMSTIGMFPIKILFLHVAHPELYPTEMFWSKMTSGITKTNATFQQSLIMKV